MEIDSTVYLIHFSTPAMPSDPTRRAPQPALVRVERELRHRELKIQAELIALRPLVAYVWSYFA